MHCLLRLIISLFHLIYEKPNEKELKTKTCLTKIKNKTCTLYKGSLYGTLESEKFSKLLPGN